MCHASRSWGLTHLTTYPFCVSFSPPLLMLCHREREIEPNNNLREGRTLHDTYHERECVASTHRGKGGCDMSRESCQLVAPLRGNRCMHTPRGLVDAASVSRVYLSLTLPPLKGLRREPWPVPATPRVGCCKDHTGWFLCTHDVAHGSGGSRRRTSYCHTAKRDFRQPNDRHSVATPGDTPGHQTA